MAYAVQADLVPRRITNAEAIELTNDTVGGNAIVAQVITDVLAEASALIDSYCRERYTVPLQASDQVKGLCISIATYLLFLRRRRVTDDIQKLYDNAIAFLKDVAGGKAGLDQPTGSPAQTSSGPAVVTELEERFSDENLGGFIP
jgi:phage gp36-like protein